MQNCGVRSQSGRPAPLFRWSFGRDLTNLHVHGGLHDSPSGLRRRRRLCAALSSPTTTELVPSSCLLEEFSSFLPARRALLWCGFVNNTTRGDRERSSLGIRPTAGSRTEGAALCARSGVSVMSGSHVCPPLDSTFSADEDGREGDDATECALKSEPEPGGCEVVPGASKTTGPGSMVQFSSVLFAQIRFLVQNLYKSTPMATPSCELPPRQGTLPALPRVRGASRLLHLSPWPP